MSVRPVLLAVLVLLCLLVSTPAPASAKPDPIGVWPLMPVPEVVADFDPPVDPYGPGHRGVDLAGVVGQGVRAAMAGTVAYAGRLAGRGVVVVSHGATRTTYEPVEASVAVGDEISTGQRVGTLESVGSHCPPRVCLHWGWLRGEVYLDPLDLVGVGPVRLLPLAGLPPSVRSGALGGWAPPTLPYAGWLPLLRLLRSPVDR